MYIHYRGRELGGAEGKSKRWMSSAPPLFTVFNRLLLITINNTYFIMLVLHTDFS